MATVVNPAGTSERDSLDGIKRIIDAALQDFAKNEADRSMAKADLDAISDKAIGAREKILTALGARSHAANWSGDDVKEAVDAVITKFSGNDKKKKSSLATFKVEVLRSTHRRVRAHVGDVFKLARGAFDAETDAKAADKDAPTPIRKAFSRAYHTATAAMKALQDDDSRTLRFDTVEDITDFAVATLKARRFDAARVKKRLDAIRSELQAFYDDFTVDGIGVCIEYLGKIDEDELREGFERAKKLAQGDDAPEPEAVPDDAPEPEAVPDDAPEPEAVPDDDDSADAALKDQGLDIYATAA